MIQDPNAPLLSELRWFVGQRWLAGLIVIFGTLASLLWMDWAFQRTGFLLVGVSILAYNTVFWVIFRQAPRWIEAPTAQRSLAWTQIALDLACLTLLSVFSEGIYSPLLGLFVLHMIFASLLLQSPKYLPYMAWALAITMLGGALWLSGQWPDTVIPRLIGIGWAGTLLLTIYFTMHITGNMRVNHERTRAVLDAAADGVLTVDHTGHIELANPAALDMFSYTSAQLVNEPVDRIFSQINLRGFSSDEDEPLLIHQSETSPEEEHSGLGVRRDGSSFPIELSISNMKLGSHDAFTIVVRDITERKRAEAELRKLNEELTNHQNQLIQHEKMVAVGRMAAGIAHEIANPLANMDGLIQLVERNPDRMKSETPHQLREQISRITQIVHQLKDFAHPIESDLQAVPVDDLIQSALDMIRFDQRHRMVSVEKNLAAPCCSVHAQSIQQVLVNLIVNALDSERENEPIRVAITSECLKNGLFTISIRDNGSGIPEEHIERIFEPFFTTKPIGQGTGLGLSISYNLVQRDGGHIEVQSEEGVGTLVTIFLPVSRCSC